MIVNIYVQAIKSHSELFEKQSTGLALYSYSITSVDTLWTVQKQCTLTIEYYLIISGNLSD